MKRIIRTGEFTHTFHRGIALPAALLVLVAMTFVAVATLHIINTLTSSLSAYSSRATINAATMFPIETMVKQLTITSNDSAARSTLNSTHAEDGYYASLIEPESEINGIPHLLQSSPSEGSVKKFSDTLGNTSYVVVERLCSAGTTDPTASACVSVLGSGGGGGTVVDNGSRTSNRKDKVITMQQSSSGGGNLQVAYRITVRVEGPKHAVTFAQAIVIV
jgi:Tfp pilus assembly protein PilX